MESMKYKRWLIPLVVLVLVAAACGDDDEPAPTSPPPAATAATQAPAATAATQAPAATAATQAPAATAATQAPATAAPPPTEPPQREELVIGVATLGTEALDPLKGPNNNGAYLRLIFDSIVGTDPTGTQLSKDTGVAQDWTISADNRVYTFTLRPGITFSNGDPVTAEDVAFTLERLQDDDNNATSTGRGVAGNTESVTVIDASTVEIRLTNPDLVLLWKLSPIVDIIGLVVSKSYFDEVGHEGFDSSPIGSGPYVLTQRQTGSFMEFEQASDNHWLIGTPRFKRVTMRVVPEENSRVAMLLAGDADFIDVSVERAQDVREAGLRVITDVKAGAYVMWFNLHEADAAAQDINVRKALSYAIDRQGLGDAFFLGEASPNGNVFMNQVGGQVLPPDPYDVEQAKAFLAETKYGAGGEQLTVQLVAPIRAGMPQLQIAETVQAYWQAIGVESEIVGGDYGTWRAAQVDKTNPTNSILMMNRFGNPHASGEANFWQHCGGLMGMTCIDELDVLIDNWRNAGSDAEYEAAVKAAEAFIVEGHYNTPILEIPLLYGANDEVPANYSAGTILSSFFVLGLVWDS